MSFPLLGKKITLTSSSLGPGPLSQDTHQVVINDLVTLPASDGAVRGCSLTAIGTKTLCNVQPHFTLLAGVSAGY